MRHKKLSVAPTSYPVTLAQAKQHLNIYPTNTDHDGYISSLPSDAVDEVESILGRALVTQTWEVVCDTWCDAISILPMGKLQSVTSIIYLDEDRVSNTVSTDDYLIIGVGIDEGRIQFRSTFTYPALFEAEAITITYVCGYGLGAVETLTLDVAPVTDWVAGDIITGQTSEQTSEVVSRTSALTYTVKDYSGLYTAGEEIGVTGVPGKLADQGAGYPLVTTSIPEIPTSIIRAIKLLIADAFSFRDQLQSVSGAQFFVTKRVEALLSLHVNGWNLC